MTPSPESIPKPPVYQFIVRIPGEPKGQPRTRAFARKFGEKWTARVYTPGTAESWKSAIAEAVKQWIPDKPLEGAVAVTAICYFSRPRSHFRANGQLKPSAPVNHTKKPDRDNLDKAILDALKTIGIFRDDCQVCDGEGVRKRYSSGAPYTELLVREMEDGE